jgi:uncharacterized protein YwqG
MLNALKVGLTFVIDKKKVLMNLTPELEKHRSLIEATKETILSATFSKETASLFKSKLGGSPYFPKDMDYPKDKNGKAMRLLAQLNFGELPKLEDFPNEGMLQFFLPADDDLHGLDLDNQLDSSDFYVIYHEKVIDKGQLLMDDFSFVEEGIDYNFPVIQPSELHFSVDTDYVSLEDYKFEQLMGKEVVTFFEQFGSDEEKVWDAYSEQFNAWKTKIGGYAAFAQEDPRLDTEMEAHNTLLFQIVADKYVDWGDMGIANFFIKRSDLLKRDFSNVLYNWDCY